MQNHYRSFFISLLGLFLLLGCSTEDAEIRTIMQHEYNRNFNHTYFAKKLKSENDNVRKAAIRSIGRIQDPESTVLLINLFNSQLSPQLIMTTIRAIGQMPANENAEVAIIKYGIDNKKPAIRIAISEALGKMGSEICMGYLAGELKSEDMSQRKAAAIAVGLLVRRQIKIIDEVLVFLEANLQVSRSDSWAAAFAMFQIAMPNKINVMREAIPIADDDTKVYLIRGIHKMINKLSEKAFIDGLDKETYEVLLEQANNKDLWKAIYALGDSPSWRVRLEVTKILGKINVDDHIQMIKKLTDDENINVCLSAWEAFGNASASKAVLAEVDRGLQSTNKNIRAICMLSYAQLNKDIALDALKTWSMDPDPFIKVATIKGLSLNPSPISIGIINSMTADANDWVQIEAFNALSVIEPMPKAVFIRGINSSNAAVVSICAIQLSKYGEKDDIPLLVNAYRQFNKAETVETAQDLVKGIIKIDPNYSPDSLRRLADPAMPQSYHILANHLRASGDTLPRINSSTGLKIFDVYKKELPRKAIMETEKGTIEINFYPEIAPQTVASFVDLARTGYFDGLMFHRVVGDFVIQGGDPDGTGWGGPGYSTPCEYSYYHFDRGTMGLATAGKDTGGSQFFFCHSPQPHLNGRYTVFGKIAKGYDILDIIERGDKILKVSIQS